MLRKTEKSAKSKDEALKLAAKELGVSVDELSYTVEREVGKGLMGLILGKEVVISAWVTKEAEEEERIKETARVRAGINDANGENPYAPKGAAPLARDCAPEERKNKKVEASVEVISADNNQKDEEDSEAPQKTVKKNREVTEKSMEDATFFVNEIVHKMGLTDATVNITNGGESIDIDISGEKMGLLIGKRGDTLNAVQYLTSLYVNKAKNSYIKINVDTENYRAKREETLVKLAKSLERRVIREGNQVSLEPMSPNERRIIHAALQNSRMVKTFSIGDEPNRKIVVAPK